MIMHYIWISDNPLPDKYFNNICTFLDLHPDWDINLWTKGSNLLNQDLFDKEKNNTCKSDLLRLELLYKYGGCYCDLDIIWHKNISGLNLGKKNIALVQEKGDLLNNAFLYAPRPKHRDILGLIKACRKRTHHQLVPAKYGPALYMQYDCIYQIISNDLIASKLSSPIHSQASDKVAWHAYDNNWR
jgi:mannosyltransferase OCH1-like enzyme